MKKDRMLIAALVSFGGYDGETAVSIAPDDKPIEVSVEFGREHVRIKQAVEVVPEKKIKRGKK